MARGNSEFKDDLENIQSQQMPKRQASMSAQDLTKKPFQENIQKIEKALETLTQHEAVNLFNPIEDKESEAYKAY